MSFLNNKVNVMESSLVELKINMKSKINAIEVKDIIDKKLQILSQYRQESSQLSNALMNQQYSRVKSPY